MNSQEIENERKQLLKEITEFCTDKLPRSEHGYYDLNDEQLYKVFFYVAKYHKIIHIPSSDCWGSRPRVFIDWRREEKFDGYFVLSRYVDLGYCMKDGLSKRRLHYYPKEDDYMWIS